MILGVAIMVSIYVGSVIAPPVSVFDLPKYLALNTDLNSYFFQGLCAALTGIFVNWLLKLPKHAVFNISIVIAALMLLLPSIRARQLDLYFAQYSILPFLVGVASCIFFTEYAQHLISQLTTRLRYQTR